MCLPNSRPANFGGVPPIGTATGTVTVGGPTWTLYSDTSGSTQVYTFVATSTINSFIGDVKPFFTYLATNNGYPASTQKLTCNLTSSIRLPLSCADC